MAMPDNKPLSYIEWRMLQFLRGKPEEDRYGLPSFTVLRNGGVSFFNSAMTAHACKAALSIKNRGWVTADEFGNHRLNEQGLHAATTLPEPNWVAPKPPKLQERDLVLLGYLRDGRWATPLDCGATNGSHHSASLMKLARNGFVATRQRGSSKITPIEIVMGKPRLTKRAKGSREYQITNEGIAFLNIARPPGNSQAVA
jgi:hypothetical protein